MVVVIHATIREVIMLKLEPIRGSVGGVGIATVGQGLARQGEEGDCIDVGVVWTAGVQSYSVDESSNRQRDSLFFVM